MRLIMLFIPLVFLQLTTISCSGDDSVSEEIADDNENNEDEGEEENDENQDNTTGKYVWWTSEEITVDDGNYWDVSSNLVFNGRIWDTPYKYSENGVDWVSIPPDGVTTRKFVNFSGNFWTERTYTSSQILTYTALSGGSTLTVNSATSGIYPIAAGEDMMLAWQGGSTAYALVSDYFHGGNGDFNYVVKTTDGGATWTPVTHQPPRSSDHNYFSKIYLMGTHLYIVEKRAHKTPGYNRIKVYHSGDGGLSGGWEISPEIEAEVGGGDFELHQIGGTGGDKIYATFNDGTYGVTVMTPTISFSPLEFKNGYNHAGKVLNISGDSEIPITVIATKMSGAYIADPISRKYYNPSSEGLNKFSGVGDSRLVIFDGHLVCVTAGRVYKTPLPLQFHDTPD